MVAWTWKVPNFDRNYSALRTLSFGSSSLCLYTCIAYCIMYNLNPHYLCQLRTGTCATIVYYLGCHVLIGDNCPVANPFPSLYYLWFKPSQFYELTVTIRSDGFGGDGREELQAHTRTELRSSLWVWSLKTWASANTRARACVVGVALTSYIGAAAPPFIHESRAWWGEPEQAKSKAIIQYSGQRVLCRFCNLAEYGVSWCSAYVGRQAGVT